MRIVQAHKICNESVPAMSLPNFTGIRTDDTSPPDRCTRGASRSRELGRGEGTLNCTENQKMKMHPRNFQADRSQLENLTPRVPKTVKLFTRNRLDPGNALQKTSPKGRSSCSALPATLPRVRARLPASWALRRDARLRSGPHPGTQW